MLVIDRRALLRCVAPGLAVLAISGCASEPPPSYPPLDFSYLSKLHLDVANLVVESHWHSGGPPDVSAMSPVQPVAALTQMAQQRIVPSGGNGTARFVIEDASIIEGNGSLSGHFAVRLDVFAGGGNRSGYAEAAVSRTVPDPQNGPEALQGALYSLVRQMMSDMNVEFEFQVRRTLKDRLQETAAPGQAVPAPVSQQSLAPPGTMPPGGMPMTAPGAPGVPLAPGSHTLGTLPAGSVPAGYPPSYAPPSYPPSGYAPPSYPPSGYAPPAYTPHAYAAPSYPPPAAAPVQVPPGGVPVPPP